MFIRTSGSKQFKVAWASVATFDGILRIEILKENKLEDVFSTFSNKSETSALSYIVDGIATVFTGFTSFRGVSIEQNGNVTVSLAKE